MASARRLDSVPSDLVALWSRLLWLQDTRSALVPPDSVSTQVLGDAEGAACGDALGRAEEVVTSLGLVSVRTHTSGGRAQPAVCVWTLIASSTSSVGPVRRRTGTVEGRVGRRL